MQAVCYFSVHKLIHIFIHAAIEPSVDESDQQSAADIISEVGQSPLPQNIAEGKSRGRGGRKVQQRERTEVGDDVFKPQVHEHDNGGHDGGHARRLVLNQQPRQNGDIDKEIRHRPREDDFHAGFREFSSDHGRRHARRVVPLQRRRVGGEPRDKIGADNVSHGTQNYHLSALRGAIH